MFFPGESLKELMQDLGISAEDIAIRSRLTKKQVASICNGECIITDEIAHGLAEALGTSPHFWMALQQVCDERNERKGNSYTLEPLAYQRAVERTFHRQNNEYDTINASMGLLGEIGELTNIFKKVYFHGHPKNMSEVIDELGDIMWYYCALANTFNFSLEKMLSRDVPSDPLSVSLLDKKDSTRVFSMISRINGIATQLCSTLVLSPVIEQVRFDIEITLLFLALLDDLHLLIKSLDLDLETVCGANQKKLETRYPNGFTTEDSIERVDTKGE